MSLYAIIINRFCVLYARPDIFGTLSGIQYTFISILMGISMELNTTFFKKGPRTTVDDNRLCFLLWGSLSFLSGLVMYSWWALNLPPKVANMEDGDERDEDENEEALPKVKDGTLFLDDSDMQKVPLLWASTGAGEVKDEEG
jgi:hypothetical protein